MPTCTLKKQRDRRRELEASLRRFLELNLPKREVETKADA